MGGTGSAIQQKSLQLQGVVHDLNNVFQTIREAAHILRTDEKWASLAGVIERSGERGQRILASLCEPAPASTDLKAVMESAIASARDYLGPSRGSSIEFACSIEPGLDLEGAPADWERCFSNLLINAAEAMSGSGRVEMHAQCSREGLEITISDGGPGIKPEHLPRVFESGFSTKPKKSGLGLHIVASIVQQNGGTISAANRVNSRGAVFRIQLPRR